jgi:hypothetical protein
MDPDATLAALLDAFRDGDYPAAWDAIEALNDWLAKGGAMPKDPRLTRAASEPHQIHPPMDWSKYESPDDVDLSDADRSKMMWDRWRDDMASRKDAIKPD